MLLEVDACDRVPTLRARLSEPVVDQVDVLVAFASEPQLERALEILVDRRCEPLGLLLGQVRRGLERAEPCPEKDLVRMGPADSGERALVAEEGMELAALAAQDLAERSCVELERIRA